MWGNSSYLLSKTGINTSIYLPYMKTNRMTLAVDFPAVFAHWKWGYCCQCSFAFKKRRNSQFVWTDKRWRIGPHFANQMPKPKKKSGSKKAKKSSSSSYQAPKFVPMPTHWPGKLGLTKAKYPTKIYLTHSPRKCEKSSNIRRKILKW